MPSELSTLCPCPFSSHSGSRSERRSLIERVRVGEIGLREVSSEAEASRVGCIRCEGKRGEWAAPDDAVGVADEARELSIEGAVRTAGDAGFQ